jgi:hypothetical protein
VPSLQDIPGVEIFGKGTKDYELPVGYVDGASKVHRNVILREMTGVEDDMLGNDDLPIGERVSNVLCACIQKIGDVSDKDTIRQAVGDDLKMGLPITEQDRIAAMVYLRRTSLGDTYRFSRNCPRCGERANNRELDLRTLKIVPVADPAKRRVQITLPSSKRKAVVKVLTAKGSIEIGRLRPSMKDIKSLALLVRLESIDDKAVPDLQGGLNMIKQLPQADRNYLRQVQNAMEASVDTDVEVKCKNPVCGNAWTFPLDVGQGFFLDLDGEVATQTLTWL